MLFKAIFNSSDVQTDFSLISRMITNTGHPQCSVPITSSVIQS